MRNAIYAFVAATAVVGCQVIGGLETRTVGAGGSAGVATDASGLGGVAGTPAGGAGAGGVAGNPAGGAGAGGVAGTPDASAGAGGDSSVGADADGGEIIDSSVPRRQGETCPAGTRCDGDAGLFCVDGYCCESACSGVCQACNVPNFLGKCTNILNDAAPAHGTCNQQAESTCGFSGKCDGQGACKKYGTSTQCGPGSCNAATNQVTPASACDGKGACVASTPLSCAPFLCNGTTACFATCSSSSQCSTGNTCTGNSCGLKGDGAQCASGTECAHGVCADGVCCDTACGGCKACNLSGSSGKCTNVASGNDPHATCPQGAGADAACKIGGCDGAGACRVAPVTTVCRAGSCTGTTQTDVAYCQANGTCPTLSQSQCTTGFTCVGGACPTSCAAPATGCALGYYCGGTQCVAKKTNGAACAAVAECSSGLCEKGRCCSGPCSGICSDCTSGTCSKAAGPDACPAIPCDVATECHEVATPITTERCAAVGRCKTKADCGESNPTRKACGTTAYQVCNGLGTCITPLVPCTGSGPSCYANDGCCSGSCCYPAAYPGAECNYQTHTSGSCRTCGQPNDCKIGSTCCNFSSIGGTWTYCTASCASVGGVTASVVCLTNADCPYNAPTCYAGDGLSYCGS